MMTETFLSSMDIYIYMRSEYDLHTSIVSQGASIGKSVECLEYGHCRRWPQQRYANVPKATFLFRFQSRAMCVSQSGQSFSFQ